VETLASENDVMDVATAAVKLAHEARGGSATGDVEIPDAVVPREMNAERGAPKGKRQQRASSARRNKDDRGVDVKRLYIGLGRSSGIRPGDIVGAIANEAGVSPKGIGAIDIADKFSIVEVREDEAHSIIAALRGTTLRGKKVTVREDRDA
jgi:ATP-dependent RNA helicase DeaD